MSEVTVTLGEVSELSEESQLALQHAIRSYLARFIYTNPGDGSPIEDTDMYGLVFMMLGVQEFVKETGVDMLNMSAVELVDYMLEGEPNAEQG